MPEQPWNLEGWAERIAATGWPEWEVPFLDLISEKCRLFFLWQPKRRIFRVQTYNDGRWREVHSVTDHEAASLIRENNRVWLAERGIWLRPANERELGQWVICGVFAGLPNYLTYDAAQAAAIDAVIQEKNDDTAGSDNPD